MNNEDLIVWPDNSWCYAEEVEEYPWKSDDYVLVSKDDPNYNYWINCQFLYDEVMEGYLERNNND